MIIKILLKKNDNNNDNKDDNSADNMIEVTLT